MKRSFFSQWLILGAALIGLGSAVAYQLTEDRGRVQSLEQDRLQHQARVIERNSVQNLIAIDQMLVGLRKQLQNDGPERKLNERLKTLTDAMPGVRTVTILDAAGKVIASDRAELIGQNFSQREYFKVPRRNPDANRLNLSPPFRSVLGDLVINVTKAMINSRGKFSGIVSATLDPEYFDTLLDSVLYAPDMRTSLVHWNGDVFMSKPEQIGMDGKDPAPPDVNFTLHKANGEAANIFMDSTAASGERRMVALKTINSPELKLDTPLVVSTSRDLGAIYADWRRRLIVDSSLYGVLVLFSILALYVFQRRQRESDRQLNEAAEALHATHAYIKESEEKYRAIIETTDTGYVIFDANGRVQDANSEYVRLSGHAQREEIIGRRPLEWTASHDRERNAEGIRKCFEAGSVRNLDIDYVDGQGQISSVEINATLLQRGASQQIVALCRDISERKRDHDQIKQLAFFDDLTKLPNRRLMLERLNLGLIQAKRFKRSLAIVFMDLDNFKDINDTLGHDVGDELLKVVAARLSFCVRSGDTVSRQGGDEFVIILTEIARPENATRVAEKIGNVMREPAIVQEHTLHVTMSVGIAVYPVHGIDDPRALMKKADIAMYEVKNSGGDGFRVYV